MVDGAFLSFYIPGGLSFLRWLSSSLNFQRGFYGEGALDVKVIVKETTYALKYSNPQNPRMLAYPPDSKA